MLGSVLVLAAVMVACSPSASDRPASVFFASGADLQSINPLVAVHPLAKQVQNHVLFLTLAEYDPSFAPQPRLASWSWSEDGTRLLLRLRDDVYWHDGIKTSAADVAWTLRMAMEPAVAYPRRRDLDAVRTVEVIDSSLVAIDFMNPQPGFPDVLTDLAILPAHRFEGVTAADIRSAGFNLDPVGNGPFEFVEYRPNQRWVFRRWDSFPVDLGRPEIERFVVVVVDESATKLAALTSGELDFAGINPAHTEFVRNNPELEVRDYPLFFSYALILNLRRSPFDIREIRQAISLAIDRQLIIDAYLYGFGSVAHGAVSPEHPFHIDAAESRYDPDSARRILVSRGWRVGADGVRQRDGERLEFSILTVGSADNALEQMIQAQLREIGVGVEIRQREMSSFLDLAQGAERDFDAIVTGVPGVLSLTHLAAMFDGDGPLAYPGYDNPVFSNAVGQARDATSAEELGDAWRLAQNILAEDLPTIWLYHARGVQGTNRRVTGVDLDLRGELASIASWSVEGDVRH